MFRTATGLHESVDSVIDKAWDNTGKMDWLGMEATLREYLENIPGEDRNKHIQKIEQIISAFTHRG